MSSIAGSGYSGESRRHDNTIVKFWEENVKGLLFGILYSCVQNGTFGKRFYYFSVVVEFLQMIIFCFRDRFHWGGIHFYFDFNYTLVSYKAYTIYFWILATWGFICLGSVLYIGYLFITGEKVRDTYVLKFLRFVSALHINPVLIPILYLLFMGIGCDYSVKPSRMLLFPSENCWGRHSVVHVFSLFWSIVFSFFMLFFALTYFEQDPTAANKAGKLQNRFELATMVTKMIYAALLVLLMERPAAFAAFALFSSIFLFITSVFVLPYYDNKLNMMKSGAYGGILWVNFWMNYSLLANDKSTIFPIILATVGIPFAIAGGAFAAHRRFKYLCDPALVDGFVSAELETITIKKTKSKRGKKGVKWGQQQNTLVRNKLFSRLLFPWDVEIASRFVLVTKPTSALIEKAKAVYQTGLSKFPKSPCVLMGYSNFMFTIVADWQLGYVALEKLRKMNSILDVQFFIFKYDRDRERRMEGGAHGADFVDFMEYKRLQKSARRHHATAMNCVRKFWRYLLEPKVDVHELSVLSSKIANAEKRASELYAKLLKNHPKNIRILRDYAKFLEEVLQDENGAREMRRKADKYENDEMERATDSHRLSYGGREESTTRLGFPESTTAPSISHPDDFSENSDKTHDDDKTSVSSKSSGIGTKLDMAKMDKHNSLKKLGYIMLATTFVVMIISLSEFAVLSNQISNFRYSVQVQTSAGGSATIASRVGRGIADAVCIAKFLQKYKLPASKPYMDRFASAQVSTNSSITTVTNCIRSLYWGTSTPAYFTSQRTKQVRELHGEYTPIDISSHLMEYEEFDHYMPQKKKIRNYFGASIYNESIYVTDPVNVVSDFRKFKSTSLWSLCSRFEAAASDIVRMSLINFTDPKTIVATITSSGYALENSPEIARGMRGLVALYSQNVESSLDSLMRTCLGIFLTTVVLLLIGCIAIFMPIVRRIFKAKVRTFTMFTLIPLSFVKMMSKRRSTAMHDASDGAESSGAESATEMNPKPIKRLNSGTRWISNQPETPEETEMVLTSPLADDTKVEANLLPAVHELAQAKAEDTVQEATPQSQCETTVTIGDEVRQDSADRNESDSETPTRLQALRRRMSLMLSLPGLNKRQSASKYTKVSIKAEDNKDTKTERKKQKRSRIDMSSLKTITRKLHLSYLIAIASFILTLLGSYLIMRNLLNHLVVISFDLQKTNFRTQYTHSSLLDLSLLTVYDYRTNQAQMAITNARSDLDSLWDIYNSIQPKSYQMDFMYNQGCPYINETKCPKIGDPLYNVITTSFEQLFFKFYLSADQLYADYRAVFNSTIDYNNTQYVNMRALGEAVLDGFARLNYYEYEDAMGQISRAKKIIGIIIGVDCVIFIAIHMILFRPFLKKLRAENEHTFAVIRMIPRNMIHNIPEIREFIQEASAEENIDV